jgi:hypothetical protein
MISDVARSSIFSPDQSIVNIVKEPAIIANPDFSTFGHISPANSPGLPRSFDFRARVYPREQSSGGFRNLAVASLWAGRLDRRVSISVNGF